MDPYMHPCIPTMYHHAPGYTCTVTRPPLVPTSYPAPSCRASRLAMGLSLAKTRCCIGLIQRAMASVLYSKYRLALQHVNRSGDSSLLGRLITKIGHGNLLTPWLTVCDLHACLASMYVRKNVKNRKIMFQLLAEKFLRTKGYTALELPNLARIAEIDHIRHGQIPELTWRRTCPMTVR